MTEMISGAEFLQWLEDHGVLPEGMPVRRVVIDASYDGPVTIYWEGLGTADLVKTEPPTSLLTAELKQLG